ncbi:MAG TPA: alpha/beta fold hydrolase [Pirellulales bacterium]|jgi:pimeloyl-ACP methyl ester carboxylesterase|nr:alpha/beta fold hydrolase [Pirellulales bacterium]
MRKPAFPSRLIVGAILLALIAARAAVADEFVDIVVPLREGGYFSPRDVCQQCNDRLGTHFPLALVTDKPQKITDGARKAIALASAVGIIRARVDDEQLVLRFRNPQDDATRLRNRELIEKYFGIAMDWPKNNGLHLPDGFDPMARTILLVHGLESDAGEFRRFRQACQRWAVQTLVFDYPNDGPIAWAGDRLSDDLKALGEKYPRLRVVIVAHSMGGLVSRYGLETPGKQPGCVTDLFTLGTPHAGSALSGAQPAVELFRESLKKNLVSWGTIQDGLGEAADDLRPGSEFLTTLNARPRPPAGVTYHVAAGTKSYVPHPVLAAAQKTATSLVRGKPRDEMLSVLGMPELQDGLGDGAVSVESALLPGVASRRTFELNHLQLILLPGERPEMCDAFQWVVQTMNWLGP